MGDKPQNADRPLRILYCRCAYANVVPEETKDAVLEKLCAAGASFDSVSDLCEMSARRDPALKTIADRGDVRIAACYDRAVRGLFRAADAPIDDRNVEVLNMRTDDADTIVNQLLNASPASAPAPPAESTDEDDTSHDENDGKDRRESA